ncbi:MAG: prepilin-type N-terminal cleavage/methylation domain-containing protein [Pirellulales bacterium]
MALRINKSKRHGGFTLVELILAIFLLGVLAALVLGRFQNSSQARVRACYVNKGNIEVQVQLWYRQKANWPANNLSDIGWDVDYFPDGLPACPVDSTAYTLDPATHEVTGHSHGG